MAATCFVTMPSKALRRWPGNGSGAQESPSRITAERVWALSRSAQARVGCEQITSSGCASARGLGDSNSVLRTAAATGFLFHSPSDVIALH